MEAAAKQSKGFLAIGFQWSFTRAIQGLKKDVVDGVYGRPKQFRTLVFWPRTEAYYRRNDWAGKLKASDGGWILDSPANNATAHFLHNMFFTAGATMVTSAWPVQVQAELYRANSIQNFDTAALRCRTDNDVEILFYTSHAGLSEIGPVFSYEFEKGRAYFDWQAGSTVVGRLADGSVKKYGNPEAEHWEKIWHCVRAVRSGEPVACNVTCSIPQVLCVNGAQDSMPVVTGFPENRVKKHAVKEGENLLWVEGLQAGLVQCYDQGFLPSEHGAIAWAKAGKVVDLMNYRSFPQSAELRV
jgi:predicted dehydrogenase